MGVGIAQVATNAKLEVVLANIDNSALNHGLKRIRGAISIEEVANCTNPNATHVLQRFS